MLMRRPFLIICLCALAASAAAQSINLPAEMADEAALPKVMPRFAKAVIGMQEDGRPADLAALFRAQLVAGLYGDALETLDKLRAPLIENPSPRVRARYLEYILYARSALRAAEAKIAFQDAYRESFRTLIKPLDNRTAAIAINGLSFDNLSQANQALAHDLDQLKGKSAISPAESLKLISYYNEREVYRAFASTTADLVGEDDARRYLIQKDIAVATPDHGTICALLVLPVGQAKLPALLQFTIYNDAGAILREARRAASNDYAGVIGLTRGKGCSPDPITPYEHDGADAAFLVDWIAAQPWSDGQVGMYGGSYSGFTPWAAAKHHPKALKVIMVGAPVAPGIDAPKEGNVFWNFIYPWPFYAANNKTLDNAAYNDTARWTKLNHDWYSSGRPYRDLDKVDGTPNPIFDRWISHPAYDAYWQTLIPYKEEFSQISIPVLQTAGYYYGGPGAAVYYLSQHTQHRPDAQHYLLIGPYDHFMAQRGTADAHGDVDTLSGYLLDAAAKIDLVELRFGWFDHVLKGGPTPGILADKINYEVTGANTWKHAPSLAAMANDSQRYYLSPDSSGRAHRLTAVPQRTASMHQTIDFADRRDVDVQSPGGGVQDRALDSTNGLVFISEPLTKAAELSGLFSGHLDFIANKSDFDFQVALYELTAAQDYIQLAPYWSRASYVKDVSHRNLLAPGKRHSLNFRSMRLMSRQMAAGSRLVAVLSILKEPEREINYGTGREVIDESIVDAKIPLRMTWFASSYLDLPIYK
jgi:putative CocE/NonD family hydrolase